MMLISSRSWRQRLLLVGGILSLGVFASNSAVFAATEETPITFDTPQYRYTAHRDLDSQRSYRDAAAHCAAEGGELSPYDGTGRSLEALAGMCFGRKSSCWIRSPVASRDDSCELLSAQGEPQRVDCDLRAPFVCRFRRGQQEYTPFKITSSDGYEYELFGTVRESGLAYDAAADYCNGIGAGLALLDIDPEEDSVDPTSALRALCAGRRDGCWVAREGTPILGKEGAICSLVSAEGRILMADCNARLPFVCSRRIAGVMKLRGSASGKRQQQDDYPVA